MKGEFMKTVIISILSTVAIFILKELKPYILNKLFDGASRKTSSILNKFKKKKIQSFYDVINTESYKHFEKEYLESYYGEEFFTDTKYGKIPVFSTFYANTNDDRPKNIRYYDFLALNSKGSFAFNPKDHQNYRNNKCFRKYYQIVGENIKNPDRPGFMLDKLILNDNNEITGFEGYIGTYAENVYSVHILEYELYNLYKKYPNKSMDYLIEKSYLRNYIHQEAISSRGAINFNEKMKESLINGKNRDSLLSVQMLVLLKNGDDYNIKIIQRSISVAIDPGRFQVVPSGGFEVFNDSVAGYSTFEIKDNYSPGMAVFREYLEEIFGEEEFEGKGTGSVSEILLKNPRIREIEKMLLEEKAEFLFLGSVMDLRFLRQELSFVLVIHDENYDRENQFLGNDESSNQQFVPNISISNFENEKEVWRKLHGPSAAMWELFKKTDLYRRLIR